MSMSCRMGKKGTKKHRLHEVSTTLHLNTLYQKGSTPPPPSSDDCSNSSNRNENENNPPVQVQSEMSEKAEKRKDKKAKQKERKRARKNRQSSETDDMWQLDKSDVDDTLEGGQVTLCKCPFRTMEYFIREIPCVLMDGKKKLFSFLLSRVYSGPLGKDSYFVILFEILGTLAFFGCLFMATYLWITLNDSISMQIKQVISWHSYWIFLGVLSSVGLGTGLHTFVLYLGPFIAKVTLAAEECQNLGFPQPPYPEQIICPNTSNAEVAGESDTVSILDIMQKVRWECLSWGLGTALGELPPYFLARSARLSDKASVKKEAIIKNMNKTLSLSPSSSKVSLTFMARAKAWMTHFVEKVGFWGILACASIPNPLFDLAGLTCGHFLVPFITFFGATLIGKMIIKSQVQMVFVILAFNERSLKRVLQCLENIPFIGPHSRVAFSDFVDHQRASLHNQGNDELPEKQNLIQYVLEKIVLCMVLYFVISIINGMAESYRQRLVKEQMKNKGEGKGKSRNVKEDKS